ncbi:MAG: DUF1837 domain-containing protein [Methanoregula sp.]|jgi:hypothetical protein
MNSETSNIGLRADPKFSNLISQRFHANISPKIDAKFFMIEFYNDRSRDDDFFLFITQRLVNYALSKEERSQINDKNCQDICKQAIRRYVTNSTKFRGGEMGDLILFHLLEVGEGAVQVINKMCIKTSGGMHSHGSDAIHFGINGQLKFLFLGESKTGENFYSTLYEAVSSVNGYCLDKEEHQLEITLASGNISDDIPPDIRRMIKDYLDPFGAKKEDFSEIHAIFLCFEEKKLKEIEEKNNGEDLIEKILAAYQEKIQDYISKISTRINAHPELINRQFIFYLLPIKDLERARKLFLGELTNAH